MSNKLNVSIAVFRIRHYSAFHEFAAHVEGFVAEAANAGSQAVLLPEFLPMGLLWTDADAANVDNAGVAAFYRKVLTPLFDEFKALMSALAGQYDIHIVGATYWHEEQDVGVNSAFVFAPDGTELRQDKLHMTRGEKAIRTTPGDSLLAFEIDGVKCGLLVCYDVQFPELTQYLAAQGIEVLFVPSLTDQRGTWRVWHSAHARALENQMFVCVSTLVGNLGIPRDYPVSCSGQAFVACPIDNRFKIEDGTLARSDFADEGLLHASLDLETLRMSREKGEVRQLTDRRPELYRKLFATL